MAAYMDSSIGFLWHFLSEMFAGKFSILESDNILFITFKNSSIYSAIIFSSADALQ